MKGSKVVRVRRGGGRGPLAPTPAGFTWHLCQFSFLWLGADPGVGATPAWEKGFPSTPLPPNSWGGSERGAVGRGGEGGFTPLFQRRRLAVPQFPQPAPRRTGRPEAGQTSRGSRRGGRIPYLGPPPRPALLRRGTDGSGLERREERGEQHLPQSPPCSAGRPPAAAPHGTARNGMTLHGTARHCVAWHAMAWNGTAWHSTAWHCMVWSGWHGNIQCGMAHGGMA